MFNTWLIQFSVKNFKSFKDRFDFSLVARKTSIKGTFFPIFSKDNTTDSYNLQVFKSSFIYGGNASWKSTVIEALEFIDWKVSLSHSNSLVGFLKTKPFLLDTESKKSPSFFEIVFSTEKYIYRYNFELRESKILSENLFIIQTKNELQVLKRKWKKITLSGILNYENAHDIANKKTWENTLFISALREWSDEDISRDIKDFFAKKLGSINLLNEQYKNFTSKRAMEDKIFKKKVTEFLAKADFSISDIKIEKDELENEQIEISRWIKRWENFKVSFSHDVYTGEIKTWTEVFDFRQESKWTQAFYNILLPIIDTLDKGGVLIIDEFNASLHPYLCKFIVNLFHNTETNPNNAQLIAVSHDTSLLSDKTMDKDQFWFTEKDVLWSSKLFSLAEFKDSRKNEDFQKKYFSGRYGGLPFIQ